MIEDKLERVRNLLKDVQELDNVYGYVIISLDGLPLLSTLENEDKNFSKVISALSSTIYGAANAIFSKYFSSKLSRIVIEGSGEGASGVKLLLTPIGDEHILLVLMSESANIGLVIFMISQVIDEITKILTS